MSVDEAATFASHAWVADLLRDESFTTIPTPTRTPKSSTEDSLFALTLQSPSTVSACLTQYRGQSQHVDSESTNAAPSTASARQLRMFLTIGDGLNGHPRVLHGGMVSTLLDECMGVLLTIRGIQSAASRNVSSVENQPVTAYLNTSFLRPIQTPSTIMVQARLLNVKEDRKWEIEGHIRDSQGQILATAECLYVRLRSKM